MLAEEMIVDGFCGGGGTSEGIEEAGYAVFLAMNHDREAIAMHRENHPNTIHLGGDIREVNPRLACGGRRVGLLWISPDCTHHSKAKGGKPRSNERRGLADVAIDWAQQVRPRVIMLENVEEFQHWGPLLENGKPDPARKGEDFRRWVGELRALGYVVEWRELVACDYGAPTKRKRLFVVARCDGRPIEWPEPTHGPGLLPYRTAADCIDWTIPCPSIFDRKKPLAEPTLRRIGRGLRKFVIEAEHPFIVDGNAHTMIHRSNGERPGQSPRVYDLTKPLGTVVAQGCKHALVTAFLAKHYGGHGTPGIDLRQPLSTITTQDHHAIVTAFLVKYYGTSDAADVTHPLGTVTACGGKFGLVTIEGEDYEITDIGMRMLTPRELFRAQGFPDSYVIDPVIDGRRISKTAQIRMAGNSVPPPMSRALVAANLGEREAVAA